MNPEIRRKIILDLLNMQEAVTIQEVGMKCKVAEITIRRDFDELESRGLIIRTHGGAVKSKSVDQLFVYDSKINQNRVNKEAICKSAFSFITDGDIIFIDCGTTLIHLTKFIPKLDSLIVITNSLPVVSELINFPNIKVIVPGGEAANERKALYGPSAERSIEKYHVEKAFIGVDGISLKDGLSAYDEKDAAITIKMADNAGEVFLLCDSSKIERNSFVKFAPLSIINYLITDKDLDEKYLYEYKSHGINILQ